LFHGFGTHSSFEGLAILFTFFTIFPLHATFTLCGTVPSTLRASAPA
jgi:hypothetical protein